MAKRGVVYEAEPGVFAMEFPTRYSRRSVVPGVKCLDAPVTRQEDKESCDINLIVKQYVTTGELPPVVANAQYGDFASGVDFREAQDIIVKAREQFDAMPSDIRDRFRNDPALFMDFVHDRNNVEECRKMGLFLPAPATPEPVVAAKPPDSK